MISFNEALNTVLDTNIRTKTEKISLHQSIGRVLAEDIISDINMPPFDKAAMDGFAIQKADIDKKLTIIETVGAGQSPTEFVESGTATKIMTGAPVPKGADFVVQVELSEMIDENHVRFTGHSKSNIIPVAEDVSIGGRVLHKGQKVDARHIAVMASVGCNKPEVYKQAKVGIISTGSEIVEPENTPNPSQIRNSNGHQLIAQVMQANGLPEYFGIIEDNYQDTFNAIKKSVELCNILLITGGVSMGEFDFVPKIMSELGVNIKFDRIAVQPGKPTTFGTKEDKFVIGLPGNPVSAFVQFEILVKPLIEKISGHQPNEKQIKLPFGIDYRRKKDERKAFIPITISDNSEVFTFEYHGSAHIYALPKADGLAVIPEGKKEFIKGELVNVRLF
ncbi:MAG: molybdopterin molybdotransferase MoeA [Salinivirgaceae bacterium]|jgi:molybdopterin molybdotransferase|nr:molybdopterin molybdotransferase MoeA [Salinivirgaceae bacterium]